MLKDWSDRMSTREAIDAWQRVMDEEVARRTARIERELRQSVDRDKMPMGFYEAMAHFLTLRSKVFPSFPADPAWRILVTLAETPPDGDKNSVTGIAHGADVPVSTALRYIAALEVEGIIERVPHATDKRQAILKLTPEGRRRLDTIAEKWATRLLLVVGVPVAMLLVVFRGHLGF